MPRVAKAVCRKIDCYPWYEFTQKFEWEDDEFEDQKWGTIEERRRNSERNSSRDSAVFRPQVTEYTDRNEGARVLQ